MINPRDIVDCAERSAVSDAVNNQVLALTGPESIGVRDVAERLTTALGWPVQYVAVPPETVERTGRAAGMGIGTRK